MKESNFSSADVKWMRLALKEALKAFGKTSPNPMVGAVVVKGGELLSKGYHHKAGEAHAEINALKDIDASAADLYVTLEPCSTHGRTGACSDAILKSGIKRVFIGTLDPNPDHAGRAVQILREKGIVVEHGIEQEKCQQINEAFNCWIRYKRPYVTLKLAMTLDGKIATESGQSKWITGDKARKEVQKLRQSCDAIMVGGETVRCDDPQLLVRSPKSWSNQPLRLIYSKSLTISDKYQVFNDGLAETRIFSAINKEQWQTFLDDLGESGITSLLVEGGGELAAKLLEFDLVDKVVFFQAPKILGGSKSRSVIAGKNPDTLASAIELSHLQYKRIGNDQMIIGYLSDVHRFS